MKEVFLKAYDRHVDALFSYCYKKIGDKERAASLTLGVFRQAWDKALAGESFEGFSFFKGIAKDLVNSQKPQRLPAHRLAFS